MIIAVDFDGTLCEMKWPEIGEPNYRLFAKLRRARAEGHKLILWTCRTDKGLEEALDFCKANGLEFDAVNDNLPEAVETFQRNNPGVTISRKVFADLYIDDLAVNVKDI